MTIDGSWLIEVARKLESAPLEAAALARDGLHEAPPGSLSLADHDLMARAFVAAAERLVMNDDPTKTPAQRRAAAVTWLLAAGNEFIEGREMLSAAEVLEQAGELSFALDDLDTAEDSFSRAHRLADQASDESLRASCLSRLGTVLIHKGDIGGALESFTEALDAYGAVGDLRGQARISKALGTLKVRSGDLEGAREHLAEALELSRDAWDRVGEGSCFRALGDLALQSGDIDGSTDAYRDALACHAIASDLLGMAGDFEGLSRAAAAAGRFARAALLLEQAVALCDRLGARHESVIYLRDQSEVLFKLPGQGSTALACLYLAVEEGSSVAGMDTSALTSTLEELLRQVVSADPEVGARLETALREDAPGVKRKGLEALLSDGELAVVFYDDRIITTEALEDHEGFFEALVGQARAFKHVGQPRAAAAAIDVALDALEQGPPIEALQAARETLRTLREELGEVPSTSRSEQESDAETLRFEAAAAVELSTRRRSS